MAGLLVPPVSGVYNVSKAAVVALTETLHHDLRLVTEQVHASVLCPFYVPTGISQSHRNRPGDLPGNKPTTSQIVSQAQTDKAVSSGKLTAADVAAMVFDAIDHHKFWIFSHPKALAGVQTRMEDAMLLRNPTDPYASRPDIGDALKARLRAE
jgi:short-subunit dehydrogenase